METTMETKQIKGQMVTIIKTMGQTIFQFSIKNYLLTFNSESENATVTNYTTKKSGIIKLSKKQRNIDAVINLFLIATNTSKEIKHLRCTILDKLN